MLSDKNFIAMPDNDDPLSNDVPLSESMQDRQEVKDLIQWIKSNRLDLVDLVRQSQYSDQRPLTPGLEAKPQKWWQRALHLSKVDPDSLHGHYLVTPELKKSSSLTASIMTTSNWIDSVGNFPCFFFAFQTFPFGLAIIPSIAMTGITLVAGNAVSSAVAQGHPGKWKWAISALVLGLIPLNILQTAATGIGVEVFNNKAELAQLEAGHALNNYVKNQEEQLTETKAGIHPDVALCRQERQALEAMPRGNALEEKAFQSRYVRIYGTFKSQSEPMTLPLDQLPLCVRANRLEAEHTLKVGVLSSQLATFDNQRVELGNDLALLKKLAPDQYQKTFIERIPWFASEAETEVSLRSGIKLVTLGTESFFDKVGRGEWSELGLNLFLLGLSAITSVVSIAMAVTFALSEDTQRSYDRSEKEKLDRWFKQMRFALARWHEEQIEELEQKALEKAEKEALEKVWAENNHYSSLNGGQAHLSKTLDDIDFYLENNIDEIENRS